MECCFGRDRCLADTFLHENCLHLGTGNNLHDVLSPQEASLHLFHHLHLDLPCNVLVIEDRSSCLVQLVEREDPQLQERHSPLVDASCMVHSRSLCLGHNF